MTVIIRRSTPVEDRPLFAILPFLKTSEPVVIRGIPFHSTTDLAGLPTALQDQLVPLLSMFFLHDNLRIRRMTYACLESTLDLERMQQFQQHLREAQTLIAYLYSAPHPTFGDPFLQLEHSSLYLLQPDSIFPSDAELDQQLVEQVTGDASLIHEASSIQEENLMRRVPGYTGYLNWNTYVSVALGQRLHAPPPHFWLNISQDLKREFERLTYEDRFWALTQFMSSTEAVQAETQDRIFTALNWHNLSTTAGISEEAALVYLAIAYESLLKLDPGEKLSQRFEETILILLGLIPGLDSWLKQFYTARSKIVHEGTAPKLMFQVGGSERGKRSSGKEEALAYRSLTTYGRHIFRLCLSTILTGAILAERAGLASLFVHNQQRLETICEYLTKNSDAPEKKLRKLAKDVLDLKKFHFVASDHVRIETVIGTGKLLIQTYLKTAPQVPLEIATLLQNTRLDAGDVEETYAYVKLLLAEIRKPYQNAPHNRGIPQEDLLGVVWSFLEYAEGALRGWLIRHYPINQPAGQDTEGTTPDVSKSIEGEGNQEQRTKEITAKEQPSEEANS